MLGTIIVGSINWDTTLFVDKFPERGEEVVVNRVIQVPGGKAGNTAVAAARLLGKDRVAIFGGLGNDPVAAEHVRVFEAEGVVTSGIKYSKEHSSGQAYVAVDKTGENTVYTYPGANATLTPNDLDEPIRRKLSDQASIVTIMNPQLDTALKLSSESKKAGKRVVCDPGVWTKVGLEGLGPVLRSADYLVCNESEMRNLTDLASPAASYSKLKENYPTLKVVQKLGGRGSILFDNDTVVTDALDLKRLGLDVVNTLGCGDSFLGAFVAALVEGSSDRDALRWATCAAGLKATKPETRGGPDRQTLLRFLDQVKLKNSVS